jgi:hypothetical protein
MLGNIVNIVKNNLVATWLEHCCINAVHLPSKNNNIGLKQLSVTQTFQVC